MKLGGNPIWRGPPIAANAQAPEAGLASAGSFGGQRGPAARTPAPRCEDRAPLDGRPGGLRGAIHRPRLHLASIGPRLCEEIGVLKQICAREVRWIALGVLRRMLQRGAIHSDTVAALARYVRKGCNYWTLNRDLAMPNFGPCSPLPAYPCSIGCPSDVRGLEPVVKKGRPSWYQAWVSPRSSRCLPAFAAPRFSQSSCGALRPHGS